MHIDSVGGENDKGFLDRQVLRFEPRGDPLVGANDAGKTTVLNLIDLQPEDERASSISEDSP